MPEIPAAVVAQWMQLGFAVAVAWYLLTKTLPASEARNEKRDASFLAAIEKRDASNAEMMEKQHVDHAAEIGRLLDHHAKQTDRVIDAVNALECSPTNRNGR